MSSEIRVNSLTNRSGLSTVSITDTGVVFSGIVTANNFKTGTTNIYSTGISGGDGVFTGDLSVSGNVSIAGTLTYEDVTSVDSVGIVTAGNGLRVTDGGLVVTAGVSTFAGITTVTGETLFTKQLNVSGVSTLGSNVVVVGDALINGLTVGGGNNSQYNTAVGAATLSNNTIGSHNTGVGSRTLMDNTTGSDNVAVGNYALEDNDTGDKNTGIGQFALKFNATGDNNTACGSAALRVVTGSNNTAIGKDAGYYIEGDNNTILGAYKGTSDDSTLNNTVIISAGTTERLRITSAGNVNIGPSANANDHGLLTLSQSAAAAFNALVIQQGNTAFTATDGLQIGIDAGVNAYFKLYENRDFYFTTGTSNTEKLRITSDGTVLMGGQTASYDGGFVNLELRKDSTTVGGSMTLVNDQSATAGATCQIDCYQNFRPAGRIVFGRENANNWQSSAAGADSFLAFHTNNSGTEAERLRITSAGRVGVNDDTSGWAENFQVTANTSHNQYGIAIKIQNNSGYLMRFGTGSAAPCGSISAGSGNSTSFNTSWSDSRRKKNFETWNEEVLPYFKSLEPKKFNFTQEDDGTVKTKGYVAQDNVDKFPGAYPSLDDSEVDEKRYMFNPSGMVIYLMKALQEEIAKREALESRITALES